MAMSFETLGGMLEISRREYGGRLAFGYKLPKGDEQWLRAMDGALSSVVPPGSTGRLEEDAPPHFAADPALSIASREWRWLSYRDFGILVDRAEAGLRGLGARKGDKIAIVSRNRLEWATVAFACFRLGAVIVPVHEEQPAGEWEFILGDAEVKIAFVSGQALCESIFDLKRSLPSLETVIGFDLPKRNEHYDRDDSYEELMRLGATSLVERLMEAAGDAGSWPPAERSSSERRASWRPSAAKEPIAATDLAAILYTAGTTGQPKGVCLSHGNICSSVKASVEHLGFGPTDRCLSVLPWAQIDGCFEMYGMLAVGGTVAVADTHARTIESLGVVRPTVLVGTPNLFNRIYTRVCEQVEHKPMPVQTLFASALELVSRQSQGLRLNLLERGVLAAADRAIFDRARENVGGNLRLAASVGAGMSPQVARFLAALEANVVETYGSTETSGLVAANRPGQRRAGTVGRPLPGVEVSIDQSVVERSGSQRGAAVLQGEVLVKGASVMQRYHRRPEATAEAMTSDGWLRTGDLGYLDAGGFLYVAGRLHEQCKLESGRSLAPAPLEEELKQSPYISNVMLYGENKHHLVAVVAIDVPRIRRWASGLGRALGSSWEEIEEQRRRLLGEPKTAYKNHARSSGVRKVRPASWIVEERQQAVGMNAGFHRWDVTRPENEARSTLVGRDGAPTSASGAAASESELGAQSSGTHRLVGAVDAPVSRDAIGGDVALATPAALCDVQAVQGLIWQEIEKYSEDFRGYERPQQVALVPEDFTVENGLLTAKGSLKRAAIVEKYRDVLEALYDTSSVKM